MRASRPTILASIVLALEGLGIGGLVVAEVIGIVSGRASSTVGGLGLLGITLIAAIALIAFAAGLLRRASWARSGGIVFQVLAIALALSSLTIAPISWLFTLGDGIPGILGLVLLILAARADGAEDRRLQRED